MPALKKIKARSKIALALLGAAKIFGGLGLVLLSGRCIVIAALALTACVGLSIKTWNMEIRRFPDNGPEV